ncbi:MAG: hypothetical protein RR357_05850 [Clostridia bacterium]
MKKIILSLVVVILIVMASSTFASYNLNSSLSSGGINSSEVSKELDINNFHKVFESFSATSNTPHKMNFVFTGGIPGVKYLLFSDVFYVGNQMNLSLTKTDKFGNTLYKQGKPISYNFIDEPVGIEFTKGEKNYYRLEMSPKDTLAAVSYSDVKIHFQGIRQDKSLIITSSGVMYQANYAFNQLKLMTEAQRQAEFGQKWINNEMIREYVRRMYNGFPKVTVGSDILYIQPYVPQLVQSDGVKRIDCSEAVIFAKTTQENGWYTNHIYNYETGNWYYSRAGISVANQSWTQIKQIITESGGAWKIVK